MVRSIERLAAAALIGECEAIIGCGLLPEQNEQALRLVVANAISSFGMQHHERFEQYDADQAYEAALQKVRDAMRPSRIGLTYLGQAS